MLSSHQTRKKKPPSKTRKRFTNGGIAEDPAMDRKKAVACLFSYTKQVVCQQWWILVFAGKKAVFSVYVARRLQTIW